MYMYIYIYIYYNILYIIYIYIYICIFEVPEVSCTELLLCTIYQNRPAQPSLAHWWNSNRNPLNPTVLIFRYEKQEK